MSVDPRTLIATWHYPTRVMFGPGRIAELASACRALGMSRPLLVTDPGLAALPMVRDALAANEQAGLPTGLFSAIRPNPIGRNVADGVRIVREGGHDGVIAFGGGSGLDAGKAIALMAGQRRAIWDFEDIGDNWTRADADAILPVVAVPTTAGTGSEVGRAAVILNEEAARKVIVFHPKMMPGIVIADAELTLGLPPTVTAATGMDALAHCLESYCATGYHPLADGVAVEGIRLIRNHLPTAFCDGADLSARAHMLAAAAMGATAFQKGLGAIHALSHPIGALYDTHHGLTNAVVMPYVLQFNRDAVEEKLTRLARWLDLSKPSFEAVMDWILALRASLGIPHTLKELGIDAGRIEELAEMAAKDPTAATNPTPVDRFALKSILVRALDGRLN